MRRRELHRWDLSVDQAAAVQARLADRVERFDRLPELRRIAGADVGFDRRRRRMRAAVAVLSWPGLELEERKLAEDEESFPYVPGLLSFREVPVILRALERLERLPDLVLCDGQGLAHPRRFGLACHLGLVADLPTIGVAKSRLVGTHAEPGPSRGDRVPLLDGGEVIGMVVRTRDRVRPLYISIGHRISLETAVEITLLATPRFRLPETTRRAHRLASKS